MDWLPLDMKPAWFAPVVWLALISPVDSLATKGECLEVPRQAAHGEKKITHISEIFHPTALQIEEVIRNNVDRIMARPDTLAFLAEAPPHLRALAEYALRRYARVNAESALENMAAKLTPEEWADLPNNPRIFADHGTGHVVDIVRQAKDFLKSAMETGRMKKRVGVEAEGMQDYVEMLAWLHDIGMQDLSASGRKAHPDRQAVEMYLPEFDKILEDLVKSNSPFIRELKKHLPGEDIKSVLRDMLSLGRAHSKSNVPADLLMYPKELATNMREASLTELEREKSAGIITDNDYRQAKVKIEHSFSWINKIDAHSLKRDLANHLTSGLSISGVSPNTVKEAYTIAMGLKPGESGLKKFRTAVELSALHDRLLDPETSYDSAKQDLAKNGIVVTASEFADKEGLRSKISHLRSIDPVEGKKLLNDLEEGKWARNYNVMPPLARNMSDALRALRAGDVLRQRGVDYRTSDNQQVYVNLDVNQTAAEIKLTDPKTGKTIIFLRKSPYATGESLTLIEFKNGNFEFTIEPGARAEQVLKDIAFVFEDIQLDAIDSFFGVRDSESKLVKNKLKVIIHAEPGVNDRLRALVEAKGIQNVEKGKFEFTPPKDNAYETTRWKEAKQLTPDQAKEQIDILRRVFKEKYAIEPKSLANLENDPTLADQLRIFTLKPDQLLLEGGTKSGYVYLPLSGVLEGYPTATNQQFKTPGGAIIGDVGVVRSTKDYPRARGATLLNLSGKPIEVLMMTPELYKKIHQDLITDPAQLNNRVKELYPGLAK